MISWGMTRGHEDRRARGPERDRAKVQIGAELLCKSEPQQSMVSGDGHRHREFRVRPFGHRELVTGFRRLKAERLDPEWLTAVAVTRHLE